MRHINLGSFKISIPEKESFPTLIKHIIDNNTPCQVVTLNSLMFNNALRDKELTEIIMKAKLVLADSVGITLAAKFVEGGARAPRMTGIGLVSELCGLSEANNWPVYFFGAGEGVARQAADNLRFIFPGLTIAGTRNGYFTKSQESSIISGIRDAGPKILFVGLSSPLQEKWIYANLGGFGVPLVMGVGGSFDVLSGRLKRAPKLFQKMGFEWLFRLIQEPRRITRMVDLPVFVWNVLKLKYFDQGS
jgi:N-acetylglucosaminyldiphosphoundecaprenol N-acetyl-beta-D-mannosaminyltransferase